MGKVAGYILSLTPERHTVLTEEIRNGSSRYSQNDKEEYFAEPVPDFQHSRNIPLVCFVGTRNTLTHIALGRRGQTAGTALRKLKLFQIKPISSPLKYNEIISAVENKLKVKLKEKTKGGALPPKTFQAVLEAVIRLAPECAKTLTRYFSSRIERVKQLPENTRRSLAEQKEALATALSIAGISRHESLAWELGESNNPTSFLDGLTMRRLHEDEMIVNDLRRMPGFTEIQEATYSATTFENESSKLTVILANKLPLERQFGTDLIYYNETFSCFIMVQYKAMEKERDEAIYRFPNTQLTTEITRMKSILEELKKCQPNTDPDGYRFSENPFFLKLCPRIDFNPDDISLIKGMYLPLDYWDLISAHKTMNGPRGGKGLSYKNVRRYLDNTAFLSVVSGGWIGSTISQSAHLRVAIRETLESGRAVVFAVNSQKGNGRRKDGPIELLGDEEDEDYEGIWRSPD